MNERYTLFAGKPINITIRIEDIQEHLEFRRKVNGTPLEHITFTLKGETVKITEEAITDWGLTGLNNIDFITTGAYKAKGKEG